MATSTHKSFLMKGTTSGGSTTYSKLLDIKSYPDLGGEPELLETTTLSDNVQTFINGIQRLESFSFTANYDPAKLQELQTLAAAEDGTTQYAVWFGGTGTSTITPTGSEGKFSFTGSLSVFANGGGVDEVRDMTITIAPSSVITFEYTAPTP